MRMIDLLEGRKAKPKGIFVDDDVNIPYPNDTIVYIQKALNINSKDKSKDWNDATELVDFTLQQLNVPKPMAFMKERWTQYVEMLNYAVRNLVDSRGLKGKWNKN